MKGRKEKDKNIIKEIVRQDRVCKENERSEKVDRDNKRKDKERIWGNNEGAREKDIKETERKCEKIYIESVKGKREKWKREKVNIREKKKEKVYR